MEIHEISDKNEYEKLHKDLQAHVLQSWEWGGLKSHYGWELLRLGIFEASEAKGLITVLLQQVPIFNFKFGYIPRGPAVKDEQDLSPVLTAVVDFLKKKGFSHVQIDPSWEAGLLGKFKEAGFDKSGYTVQIQETVVLNLEKSEEELLSDMRGKTRQYIRKAQKHGVAVVEGENEKDVEAFCRVVEEIVRRKGYIMHSSDYYKRIWEIFKDGGKVKLFLAKQGDEVVGAIMLFLSNGWAYEMYGGVNEKGDELLANYLLKWECIRRSKELACEFYDQWGVAKEGVENHMLAGITQFKKGFGGKYKEFLPNMVFVCSSFKYFVYKLGVLVKDLRVKFGLVL